MQFLFLHCKKMTGSRGVPRTISIICDTCIVLEKKVNSKRFHRVLNMSLASFSQVIYNIDLLNIIRLDFLMNCVAYTV